MMDRGDTGLEFQRILVTEDESLDSHNNIITQLQLEDRLPEGRQTCDRLLEDLGLQPAQEDQGDRTCKQFVFQGQCLVLGDSGVGKTSLVKSLTGKPFDLEQPKTQGVEFSVVDQKWQNLDLKDLVFGNVSRFFKEILVQLTILGKAGNVIVQESTFLSNNTQGTYNFMFLLFIFSVLCSQIGHPSERPPIHQICLGWLVIALVVMTIRCVFHWERFRLIVFTHGFVVNYRGLIMGGFLSVMSKSYISGMPAISYSNFSQVSIIHAFLFITTVAPLVTEVFYLCTESRSFRIERKCRYPGLLIFRNQRPVEIILIGRFVYSVIIGFSFFTVLMKFNLNKTNELTGVTKLVVIYCHVLLILQSVPRIVKSLGWHQKAGFIVAIFCFYCVGVLLPLDVQFVITFLIFYCDTVYIEYFCLTSALANIGNDRDGSTVVTAVCIEKAVINQRNLRNALNQKFSSLKLKILDFAGDKEYQAYHHMFLRSQAIYVIVFNMAELVENRFRDINTRIKTLHQWFESVCSHVPPQTPIFLVGTHRGDMNKICMESINSHLRRNLWDLYCDEIIENDVEKLIYFPVENSLGQNDAGVLTLQKKLMNVAEEYKGTMGCGIPLSWIQIQDAIIHLREKKEAKFCVTLEEFPTAFGNFICTNWSEETLKYFHEKGLVIYLDKDEDLSKWVLLKPEILVDIIIQLVTPPQQMTQERGYRHDWKLLHDEGMLTKSLLKRIISTVQEHEEAMTAFLEEYDLICPLSNKKVKKCSLSDDEEHQPTHFVPSLLPMSEDGSKPVWHDDTTDKTFYVFFKRFLPEPLFHRLLSRAHKNSMLEYPNGQPVLYRDAGMFWMNPLREYTGNQPYRLKLLKEEGMIEVTFSSSDEDGMKPSDVLTQVFSMVSGIHKRDFPFVKFHCGPACLSPQCPGNRRHVYDIMPGRQRDKLASLDCINHSFKNELKEWLPQS
ncbi:uncharacterized protein LOC144651655 isoform X2 [Oculina patagonica]